MEGDGEDRGVVVEDAGVAGDLGRADAGGVAGDSRRVVARGVAVKGRQSAGGLAMAPGSHPGEWGGGNADIRSFGR